MRGELTEVLSYPSLNPAFVPVFLDENTVHLRAGAWDGPIKTIRDPEESGDVKRLFEALDGRTHVTELLEAFDPGDRDDVAELLLTLADDGIVYDSDSRSAAWAHAAINPDMKAEGSTGIREKPVLVVSNGPLGRQLAGDLVARGLGDVTVATDRPDDAVAGVGDRSALSTVDLAESGLRSAVRDAAFVVACSDRPHRELFRLVNDLAVETDTPWTAGQVLGRNGVVGPTVFPGETACYACFERRLLSNAPDVENCLRYLGAGGVDGDRRRPSPLARTVSGYLAMDLFNLLAFGSGYTAGRVLTVDSLTLSFSAEDVLRVPRCSVCADTRLTGESPFITVEDLVDIADGAGR